MTQVTKGFYAREPGKIKFLPHCYLQSLGGTTLSKQTHTISCITCTATKWQNKPCKTLADDDKLIRQKNNWKY